MRKVTKFRESKSTSPSSEENRNDDVKTTLDHLNLNKSSDHHRYNISSSSHSKSRRRRKSKSTTGSSSRRDHHLRYNDDGQNTMTIQKGIATTTELDSNISIQTGQLSESRSRIKDKNVQKQNSREERISSSGPKRQR